MGSGPSSPSTDSGNSGSRQQTHHLSVSGNLANSLLSGNSPSEQRRPAAISTASSTDELAQLTTVRTPRSADDTRDLLRISAGATPRVTDRCSTPPEQVIEVSGNNSGGGGSSRASSPAVSVDSPPGAPRVAGSAALALRSFASHHNQRGRGGANFTPPLDRSAPPLSGARQSPSASPLGGAPTPRGGFGARFRSVASVESLGVVNPLSRSDSDVSDYEDDTDEDGASGNGERVVGAASATDAKGRLVTSDTDASDNNSDVSTRSSSDPTASSAARSPQEQQQQHQKKRRKRRPAPWSQTHGRMANIPSILRGSNCSTAGSTSGHFGTPQNSFVGVGERSGGSQLASFSLTEAAASRGAAALEADSGPASPLADPPIGVVGPAANGAPPSRSLTPLAVPSAHDGLPQPLVHRRGSNSATGAAAAASCPSLLSLRGAGSPTAAVIRACTPPPHQQTEAPVPDALPPSVGTDDDLQFNVSLNIFTRSARRRLSNSLLSAASGNSGDGGAVMAVTTTTTTAAAAAGGGAIPLPLLPSLLAPEAAYGIDGSGAIGTPSLPGTARNGSQSRRVAFASSVVEPPLGSSMLGAFVPRRSHGPGGASTNPPQTPTAGGSGANAVAALSLLSRHARETPVSSTSLFPSTAALAPTSSGSATEASTSSPVRPQSETAAPPSLPQAFKGPVARSPPPPLGISILGTGSKRGGPEVFTGGGGDDEDQEVVSPNATRHTFQ